MVPEDFVSVAGIDDAEPFAGLGSDDEALGRSGLDLGGEKGEGEKRESEGHGAVAEDGMGHTGLIASLRTQPRRSPGISM